MMANGETTEEKVGNIHQWNVMKFKHEPANLMIDLHRVTYYLPITSQRTMTAIV